MTQDYWENLYFITLRAQGRGVFPCFIVAIYIGSFYLVNLILAVVAMAYEEQHNLVVEDEERQKNLMEKKKQELQQILKSIEDSEGKSRRHSYLPSVQGDNSTLAICDNPNTHEVADPQHQTNGSLSTEPASNVPQIAITQQPSNTAESDVKRDNLTVNQGQNYLTPISGSRRGSIPERINELTDSQMGYVKERAMSQASIMTAELERKERPCPPCFYVNSLKLGIWDCWGPWNRIQKLCQTICMDPFFDLAITLCILGNTAAMAAEAQPMSQTYDEFSSMLNTFFTWIFTFEMVVKIVGLHPYYYFQDSWNIFDSCIVTVSLMEKFLESLKSVSALRTFRLARVFKLAKSWTTLNTLMKIIGNTLGSLVNLTIVLALVLFIFAVVSMQLFNESYERVIQNAEKQPFSHLHLPRWHMYDFFHSFLIVFRILCGEWIETMWDCKRWGSRDITIGGSLENGGLGAFCVPVFLMVQIIGNLVVLNLFLALLLSSFSSDSLGTGEADGPEEPNNIALSIGRFKRLFVWISKMLKRYMLHSNSKNKNLTMLEAAGNPPPGGGDDHSQGLTHQPSTTSKTNCNASDNRRDIVDYVNILPTADNSDNKVQDSLRGSKKNSNNSVAQKSPGQSSFSLGPPESPSLSDNKHSANSKTSSKSSHHQNLSHNYSNQSENDIGYNYNPDHNDNDSYGLQRDTREDEETSSEESSVLESEEEELVGFS